MYNQTNNTFTKLGTGGGIDGTVYAIYALSSSQVYIGGVFTTASSITVNCITMWNGNVFTALGTSTIGVDNTVNAIYALSSSQVYIGGSFTNASGITVNNITMYNQTNNTFTTLGTPTIGVNSIVKAIYALSSSQVYIGGHFANASGITVYCITMWNGNTFTTVGNGFINQYVAAIYALDSEHVYIGGGFTKSIGGNTVYDIVMWTG